VQKKTENSIEIPEPFKPSLKMPINMNEVNYRPIDSCTNKLDSSIALTKSTGKQNAQSPASQNAQARNKQTNSCDCRRDDSRVCSRNGSRDCRRNRRCEP
jgi:hypothetical protein